jgi:hypothetical protein
MHSPHSECNISAYMAACQTHLSFTVDARELGSNARGAVAAPMRLVGSVMKGALAIVQTGFCRVSVLFGLGST